MADADDADLVTGGEELRDGLGQRLDGTGRGLLDQDIATFAVFKGEEHQIHRLLQTHDEPGHGGFCDGDGLPCPDLIDPQGHHGSTAAQNITVTGTADPGIFRGAALGHHHLLHHGLGGAHGVDGIGGLVRGQTDHALDPQLDGGGEHVVGADHVGLHGFHGEELAGGHLLQRGGVEDIVHPPHGILHGADIPDIADIVPDLLRHLRHGRLKLVAHIVLLLLVPGEDADLPDIRIQKPPQHRVAEAAGTAGDQ